MSFRADAFTLDRNEELFTYLLEASGAAGLSAILRAQRRRSRSITVQNGRTEQVSHAAQAGIGLHLFDPEGHGAFGSMDGLSAPETRDLLGRVIRGVRAAGSLALIPTRALTEAVPYQGDHPPPPGPEFDDRPPEESERDLLALCRDLQTLDGDLRVRVSLSLVRDEWRVLRSDGTDTRMVLPRGHLAATFSAGGAGSTASVRSHVFSSRFDLLSVPSLMETFLCRARAAAVQATALPAAPHYPAGVYPLVIDHALAKGLAHEAFGHAAESDSFRSSILASQGRFRSGMRVGGDHISIVDEPIRGDHAYQPVSANGVPRQRVDIVRRGRLHEALADLFSAEAGGVPVRGCGRAESYRHPPLARMSNIRIQVAEPVPIEGAPEAVTPERLRDLLGEAGAFNRHRRIVFLSGYAGGQVNTVKGDFVFNCYALYELTPTSVRLFRPALFSGPVLEALRSVRTAFGPLRLDAGGTCGKWGQNVPSCGGSNSFLLLDPNPDVLVGGH